MEAATNTPTRTRLDVSDVARRFGRHTVTLTRWEREGILPPSHRVGGRRCWYADEVVEAERRLANLERARPAKVPPERAIALAASGRAAKEANRKLRDAAAEALAVGGFQMVGRVLKPFSPTGRLNDIPNGAKLDATVALLRAVGECAP